MAKIARKNMKIFGSTPGTQQVGVIGSFAAGSAAYSSDPEAIQALANYLVGMYAITVGANSPAMQDLNAIFFLFAYQLTYIFQTGVPEWTTSAIYFKGSLVNDGAGSLYTSLTDNNTGNFLTDATNWAQPGGVISTVTANTAISANAGTIRSNSTSGALTHTLPSAATVSLGKTIKIKDVGTGGFTTSLRGNSSDTIDGNVTYSSTLGQYDSLTVQANGAGGWDVI